MYLVAVSSDHLAEQSAFWPQNLKPVDPEFNIFKLIIQ